MSCLSNFNTFFRRNRLPPLVVPTGGSAGPPDSTIVFVLSALDHWMEVLDMVEASSAAACGPNHTPLSVVCHSILKTSRRKRSMCVPGARRGVSDL